MNTTRLAWFGFALVAAWIVGQTLGNDFTELPRVGDSASFVLQSVSFADSFDLSLDHDDFVDYVAQGWGVPVGLFIQAHGDGWAFAKPWPYSAVAGVALKVTDDVGTAYALTNTAVLVALGGVLIGVARRRLRGPVVPVLVGAFLFASHVWLYAFVPYTDLFVALVVGLLTWAFLASADGAALLPALATAAVAGFVLPEKPPFAVIIGPMLLVILLRQSGLRPRVAVVGTFAAMLALASVPYLWASDGASWNAYGGERYYTFGEPPFGDQPGRVGRSTAGETFSPEFVVDRLTSDPGPTARATAYTLIGRHTGLLVFFPLALVVVAPALRHGRRPEVAALLVGLLGYVGFYALLFPFNYYGGGAALGNRYFLQASPLVLGLAVAAPIPVRTLLRGAAASTLVGIIFLYPHFRHPEEALLRLDRTSPLQRILPFEANQEGAEYLRCGSQGCPSPPPEEGATP